MGDVVRYIRTNTVEYAHVKISVIEAKYSVNYKRKAEERDKKEDENNDQFNR